MANSSLVFTVQAVERQSGTYTARLVDENGQPVGSSVLTSFTLTLYDLSTAARTIINSRSTQDVLNANQVSLDANGYLTWTWLPADQAFVNPNRTVEEHVALFTAKWLDGSANPREANHEVHFIVARVVLNA